MTKALTKDEYPFRIKMLHGKTVIAMRDTIDDVPGSRDFLKTKQIDKNQEINIDSRISGKVIPLSSIVIEDDEEVEFPNDNDSIIIEDFDWRTIRGKQILIRKGNPGALNGNDMRKINIAVDAAHADFGNRGFIREKFVKSYIPENRKFSFSETVVLGGSENWVGSPSAEFAANMVVGDNVMKGRWSKYKGLSPNQFKAVKKSESAGITYPPKDMQKSISVMRVFNQRMAEKEFGKGPITMYRGIYGDQATAIKKRAKKGDLIRINSNALSSWTNDRNIAERFMKDVTKGPNATRTGVLIKARIKPKHIFDSYASSPMLGSRKREGEQEIIISPRGLKITGVIM